jgi:hypothetical protein
MYYKAVFDLYRPIGLKIPEEYGILEKMSVNPLFAAPPVPYVDATTALDNQVAALAAAQNGGIERTADMRTKEKVVDNIILQYKLYVTNVANGNTDIILSSGFRHTKPRESAGDMPKVTGVEGVPSEINGLLKARWNSVAHSSYFEVEIQPVDAKASLATEPAQSPAATLDQWEMYTTQTASIKIDSLKSLTYYQIRVRAKGAAGYGAYSDLLELLVI